MNKEEILERSRGEKRDEGKEFVSHSGRKTGVMAMVILFVILAVFSLYNNRQETTYALITMFFGYLGSESFGMYKLTHAKTDLLKTVIGCIVCIVFLVLYINGVAN
ncbi:DUF6442 family protein [Paenibacillus sp. MMS20-IR301]|uniref:DUF6442 family protein n=1 Tax=Paenibacillus sp. MMS20-IR301 TaxID=2895946 RepID=UPI0028E93272|nr:DUF6442 family protein [Paenibacillus sp. MMS20-IR301]WNS42327.1 DUF6442 family protein [Paenibacillus sp. MMS20-IR301]